MERTPDLRRRDPGELIARGVVAGLFLGLAYRIALQVLETGRLSGIFLLVSELLVGILTLVRRPARSVDRSWLVRGVTLLSIAGPNLVRPASPAWPVDEVVVLGVSVTGLTVVIAGKLSLGRSLGFLPANRGVVVSGLYRLVRHPIYLGYLVTHVAGSCWDSRPCGTCRSSSSPISPCSHGPHSRSAPLPPTRPTGGIERSSSGVSCRAFTSQTRRSGRGGSRRQTAARRRPPVLGSPRWPSGPRARPRAGSTRRGAPRRRRWRGRR